MTSEKQALNLGDLDSDRPYLQMLNAFHDMVLVKGPASKILWANRAFCEYYGKSNEELVGIVDADFNETDYTAQYVQDDERVFKSGQSLDIPIEPVTRHDGQVRMFHSVKSPIFDAAGKVVMTIGISRDITEKLRTQQSLEHERARAVHASKMATLGEVAAGLAHEVNTPLAIIHGLSEQLLEAFAEPAPDREFVTTSLRTIESTTLRISKIVRALHKFARDSTTDTPEECGVAQLIEDALSFPRGGIAWHGIHLETALPPSEVRLECNSTLIAQVLLNLLTNARDAVIGRPDKRIRIAAIETESDVEISVTNSGPGIPPENREKIFLPFFTTKAPGKGTGLGLSISRTIVENHGGGLFLDTSAAETRFVVRLPKRSAKRKTDAPGPGESS